MNDSDAALRARSRRSFLKSSSALVGGVFGATTLQMLDAHQAWAASHRGNGARGQSANAAGYGPLVRTPDQNGDEILALPHGFHYVTFGVLGTEMIGGNGVVHPRNHDGMGAFSGPGGTVRLIRNHEVRNAPADGLYAVPAASTLKWDDVAGAAGTVTLDFDVRSRRVVREFVSLSGTAVNCSGGLAYRDAGWITCEETTVGVVNAAGNPTGWTRRHGYAFLVPADANQTVHAQPILGMGRFAKEAALADNATGIVYVTEDSGNNSGFYRYLPVDPANLHAGGLLQMLAVKGTPQYDTRTGQRPDAPLAVEWVTIDHPDPGEVVTASNSCFAQGFAKGGARFNRLEGIFRTHRGSFVFVSTSGGDAERGQMWEYAPAAGGGWLALRFESAGTEMLESPDNLCVTPNGGILFCEDDAAGNGDSHPLAPDIADVNRLIGLSPDGVPFEFAVNVLNDSEFAGACFSPDGRVLFVNLFGDGTAGSGMTCAIYGPFERGPL